MVQIGPDRLKFAGGNPTQFCFYGGKSRGKKFFIDKQELKNTI
jgi:hypothetical protein